MQNYVKALITGDGRSIWASKYFWYILSEVSIVCLRFSQLFDNFLCNLWVSVILDDQFNFIWSWRCIGASSDYHLNNIFWDFRMFRDYMSQVVVLSYTVSCLLSLSGKTGFLFTSAIHSMVRTNDRKRYSYQVLLIIPFSSTGWVVSTC